jgi:nuclear transport factor 2 (NTF2) superfamily protein
LDDAVELLASALARDEAEPVDHAWLTLQHARMCAEVGRLDEARSQAISVQRIGLTSPDDVTATAIAGAAAELLFNTAAWGQRDVEDVITGGDTAASWWRTQTMSWALSAFADRTFKDWAADSAVTVFRGIDTVHNQLLAASLTANYAGDHGDWRHFSALLGQDALMRLDRHGDPEEAHAALETLRLAGDDRAVKLAVQRLAADGPATAISLTAAGLRLDTATRTTGLADLVLLQYGGDLIDETTAGRAIAWLLSTLDDPSAFITRTTPSYLVDLQIVDTLAAVAPAAAPAAVASVVGRVIELTGQQDQARATSWARVVQALPDNAWTERAAVRAGQVADGHDPVLRFLLLAVAARYSDQVKSQLIAEARSGSLEAIAALGDVRDLPAEVVANAVISLSEQADQQVRDAGTGNYGFGDIGRMLALLNAWHPASANWHSLLNLLGDDAVAGGHKIGAFQVLASLADLIPDEIRSRLGAIAVGVAERPSRGGLPLPIGGDPAGAAILMASALGILDTEWIADRFLGLLAGDPDEQRWAARAARQLGWPEDIGILVTLAQAEDTNVRATAAASLASLVAAGRDNALAVTALRRCTRDPGARVPGTVAFMIANAPARAPATHEVLDLLRGHTSAYVRVTATRALEDADKRLSPEVPVPEGGKLGPVLLHPLRRASKRGDQGLPEIGQLVPRVRRGSRREIPPHQARALQML